MSTSEADREIVRERYSAYKDPEVAHFLLEMLERGLEITPVFDLKYGYRYPEVEKITGKNPIQTREFLHRLARVGILDEELYDMSIKCPSCNHADISTNYVCPFCNSPRIIRNALIEHIRCGYIDNLTKFRTNGDLICPRCKAKIGKEEYRSAGSWYECLDCKKRIETPQVIHLCRDCKERFTFDDALYHEVYRYRLSKQAISEIKSGALFSSLAKRIFTDLDYEVKVPSRLIGESGIQHEFDILARGKDGKTITLDTLFSSKPIGPTEIIREYGKIFDTKAEAYIVASPSLDEEAKKLARSYGLNVIEGDPTEALNELKKALTKGMGAPKRSIEKEKAATKLEKIEKAETKQKAKSSGVLIILAMLFLLLILYYFLFLWKGTFP